MKISPYDMVHLVNARVIGARGMTHECIIGTLAGCYIAKSQCEYDEFTGTLLVKRWLLNKNRDKWRITFSGDKKQAYGSDETLPAIHYIDAIRNHIREIEHCLKQLEHAPLEPDDDTTNEPC